MRTRMLVVRGALVLAAMAVSACKIDLGIADLSNPPGWCGFLFESRPCVALAVHPQWPGLLKGDTVRVYTQSDSGYGAPITWAVTGAAELVAESEMAYPGYQGARSILVRGLEKGSATVIAKNTPTNRTAMLGLVVADSSEITSVSLHSVSVQSSPYGSATTTVRVGDSLWVFGRPVDASWRTYGVRIENWTTSDATIATTITHPFAGEGLRTWIRGRAPGAVDVNASFHTASGTLRITVIP
jgi:hypothetical protein